MTDNGATPLDRDAAIELAEQAIVDPEREYVLLEEKIDEREFGWVFFYQTKAYLESGDPSDTVPGVGPFIVLREGGEPVFLTTSVPPQVAIAEFEKDWRASR